MTHPLLTRTAELILSWQHWRTGHGVGNGLGERVLDSDEHAIAGANECRRHGVSRAAVEAFREELETLAGYIDPNDPTAGT